MHHKISFLFLFLVLFSLNFVCSTQEFGYNNKDKPILNDYSSFNNATAYVNNSYYLRGLTPQEVADLYVESPDINCNSTGSCSSGGVAYMDYTNNGNFTINDGKTLKVGTGNFSVSNTNLGISEIKTKEGFEFYENGGTQLQLQISNNAFILGDGLTQESFSFYNQVGGSGAGISVTPNATSTNQQFSFSNGHINLPTDYYLRWESGKANVRYYDDRTNQHLIWDSDATLDDYIWKFNGVQKAILNETGDFRVNGTICDSVGCIGDGGASATSIWTNDSVTATTDKNLNLTTNMTYVFNDTIKVKFYFDEFGTFWEDYSG